LEEKIAMLEREKLELQKALKAEQSQHTAACTEAETEVEINKNLTNQLAEVQVRFETAEARATKAEEKRRVSCKNFKVYHATLSVGMAQLQEEGPRLLSAYGLIAPELAGPEDLEIQQFFKWLRACLAMVDSGSYLYGDLCAIVAT
jgi:hypothetical protein